MNKNKVKVLSIITIAGLAIFPLLSIAQVEPIINNVNPSIVMTNSGNMIVTVNGSGFANGSWVNVNGGYRSTTYVSSNQLTALLPASDTNYTGTLLITVSNPAWVAGSIKTSNVMNLIVTSNFPTTLGVTSISPNSAFVGSQVTITVNGQGFVNGSMVRFNGVPVSTSYISSSRLIATIPYTLLSVATDDLVRVENPGGLVSNSLYFHILPISVPGLPNTGVGPAK